MNGPQLHVETMLHRMYAMVAYTRRPYGIILFAELAVKNCAVDEDSPEYAGWQTHVREIYDISCKGILEYCEYES